jgi:hypothetical protein
MYLFNFLGLRVADAHLVRFSDFKSLKFCGSDFGKLRDSVFECVSVVSVPKRVKKGFMLSKFFTDFNLVDSELFISLSCHSDRFFSTGSKLFDLILATHCYSKMGLNGSPIDLLVYGFLNNYHVKVSYIEALKSVFNNVKRCLSVD